MAKYFNQQKIAFVQRILNGEHPAQVAQAAGVSPVIINDWCRYYSEGKFLGREHLCTVILKGRKKNSPIMSPQRVESIVKDYVGNTPPIQKILANFPIPTVKETPQESSIIADLTRRVAMLEKVVLR